MVKTKHWSEEGTIVKGTAATIPVITSYVIGFTGPMKSLNTLNSIDNNQNIAWDKGAHSQITEIRRYVPMTKIVSQSNFFIFMQFSTKIMPNKTAYQ